VFVLKMACKEQETARQANGLAAQPSRRLHVQAYLTRPAFETRGAEAPSQRTAPGRLQRRVRPPLSAERLLTAARATPCTTRSRRQHAPVTRGSTIPKPLPVLRARASRDDFARSRPSARNRPSSPGSRQNTSQNPRRSNGLAAQPSRRLHVPAYLTHATFKARGAEAPSQRTAPGRLQRRVRPPLSAERLLTPARATRCTTRSRRQHAPVTRGSTIPKPLPVLRARASRGDFARSRPSARNRPSSPGSRQNTKSKPETV